jgi:segregation and condensation protein B
LIEPIDVLEALLFASDAPVEAATIQDVLELPSADAARELVAALRARLEAQRALQVIEAGGGFRLVTRPEVAPWLVRLARAKTKSRLSRPALETLAIVAYRQPVSRPEVDATRGVNSEGVLDNLLERRLIRIAGRKESAGRPYLYETTREFLIAFGLRDLGDLPKVDGELVVPDPAAGTGARAETSAPDGGAEPESAEEPESYAEPEPGGDPAAHVPLDADAEREARPAVVAGTVEAGAKLEAAVAVASADHVDTGPEADATAITVADPGTPPAAAAEIGITTEDASAGDEPAQQDPGAGGPDVASRS